MPQIFFPIGGVTIAQSNVNYNWDVLDLSPYIPAGATGAIVYIWNSSSAVRPWGIRMNGSSDTRIKNASGNIHCWGIVGVDANRRIQFNNQTTWTAKCGCRLLGYTMPGVTMLQNGIHINAGFPGGWQTIDLSAWVPATAIGVIVEIDPNPGMAYGIQMPGSSDFRIADCSNQGNQFTAIVGCTDQKVEARAEGGGSSVRMYLLGYIEEGATFYLNALDMTPPGVATWQLCPNSVPGVLAFIEMVAPAGGTTGDSVRAYPGGWGPLRVASLHPWAIVQAGAGGQVEGQKAAADTTFWMTGYAHGLLPPQVTTDPATAISDAAATLNGTLDDDGGEACDCGFEWGETIAYGNTTPTQSRTTGQTFAQTITGLDRIKTYHFRAFATNSMGTSYGADRTFTTLATAPTVVTDPATAISDAAATLNGTLDDDGGEACDCGFEWGETIAYGNTTPTQSRTTGQTFSQVISGLDPNKTYHFRAFATNSAGTGYGDDRTFTTLAASPLVTTDPATGLGATLAVLNGTLDDDIGEACDCGFEWGLDTGYGTITATESKTTGQAFSRVIGGLVPNTTYHFRAFATNSFGTGYGADRTFTTALVISKAYALAREEL